MGNVPLQIVEEAVRGTHSRGEMKYCKEDDAKFAQREPRVREPDGDQDVNRQTW